MKPIYKTKLSDETEAYMFVHFVGGERSADEEQVYFSVSKDGRKWDILNGGKKILTSTVGEKGVRDPYITRSPQNNKFYIIATDLSIYNRKQKVESKTAWIQCQNILPDNPNPGSNKMVVWESDNLTDWKRCAACAGSTGGRRLLLGTGMYMG